MIDIRRQRQSLREDRTKGQGVVRLVVRGALLLAIVGVALLRGYPARAWLGVLVAVVWGASLPWMLRGVSRLLASSRFESWQKTTLMWVISIVVVGAFAVTVRILLIP